MATPATGRPRGRPKGARNRRTDEREAAVERAAQTIAAVVPDAFDGDAHALLMLVYKDPKQSLETRIEAAKAAIRYEKPALSSVAADLSGKVDGRLDLVTTYSLPDNGR